MESNPFQFLRKLVNITQLGMASKTGMSRSTIVYIETGQFPHLSDYMVTMLYAEVERMGLNPYDVLLQEYGVEHLEDAYGRWCQKQRMKSAHKFRVLMDPDEFMARSTVDKSPFGVFVEMIAGTKQRFCKMLKVSDAAVFRYSKGEAKTMPLTIEEALNQVGFPYLDQLKEIQEQWLSSFA